MSAYRIYVEDEDSEKVILSVLVDVQNGTDIEPETTGVATDKEIKRALVAAAGIQLGEEWWKDDEPEATA
jgi:hypothetical protein